MNILVACEESQEVCKELRKRGHRAFSCDIQECSGGHPEWHIMGDVTALVNGNCSFKLQNGTAEEQTGKWNMWNGLEKMAERKDSQNGTMML